MNINNLRLNYHVQVYAIVISNHIHLNCYLFQFLTNECEKLLQYAETWQNELSGKFPKREYKTTVVDVNGKSVFVTRYFKALKPPEELVKGDVLETAVRMSLISKHVLYSISICLM